MITERIQYILGYSKKEFTQRNESESDVVKKVWLIKFFFNIKLLESCILFEK